MLDSLQTGSEVVDHTPCGYLQDGQHSARQGTYFPRATHVCASKLHEQVEDLVAMQACNLQNLPENYTMRYCMHSDFSPRQGTLDRAREREAVVA